MSGQGCSATYVSGYRRGEPCPYRAIALVGGRFDPPFLVCGYHARAYDPSAVYPLDWSLARIRRWRLDNLAATDAPHVCRCEHMDADRNSEP